MSQHFAWGGQSTGVLASFLPKKSQGWSPSEWTGWISLQSKGLSRVFSNTTVQKHQFFGAQLSSQSNSHIHTWLLKKTTALTRRTLVGKEMSLLLNMLSSSTLATSCEELTHWKRLWCWEGLGAGEEGDDQGWDGWMASLTRGTWVWVNSGSWWWTGRPGVLRFMGSQRVGHNWATELD